MPPGGKLFASIIRERALPIGLLNGLYTGKEYSDEGGYELLLVYLAALLLPEELLRDYLVNNHADEGLGRVEGVYVPERPVLDARFYIVAEKHVDVFDVGFEEHVGEVVPFERAEVEETHEGRVLAAPVEHARGDRREDEGVVLGVLVGFERYLDAGFFEDFLFDDRAVEVTLGGEVPEDEGFVDLGLFGYLFGCRSVESLFGKKLYRGFEELVSRG